MLVPCSSLTLSQLAQKSRAKEKGLGQSRPQFSGAGRADTYSWRCVLNVSVKLLAFTSAAVSALKIVYKAHIHHSKMQSILLVNYIQET